MKLPYRLIKKEDSAKELLESSIKKSFVAVSTIEECETHIRVYDYEIRKCRTTLYKKKLKVIESKVEPIKKQDIKVVENKVKRVKKKVA